MPKLSEVSKLRERNPQIKPEELKGRIFSILDCSLPIMPKRSGGKFEPRPFVIFTVAPDSPTPEEVDAGGVFDLLLSYQEQGQRADLSAYFNDPDNAVEPIGPVTLSQIDVGQPMLMWAFEDAPEPAPTGNGKKAK